MTSLAQKISCALKFLTLIMIPALLPAACADTDTAIPSTEYTGSEAVFHPLTHDISFGSVDVVDILFVVDSGLKTSMGEAALSARVYS